MCRRTSSRQSHQPILVGARMAQERPRNLQTPTRRGNQHRSTQDTDQPQRSSTQTPTREGAATIHRATRPPRVPGRRTTRLDRPRRSMGTRGTIQLRPRRNTANRRGASKPSLHHPLMAGCNEVQCNMWCRKESSPQTLKNGATPPQAPSGWEHTAPSPKSKHSSN